MSCQTRGMTASVYALIGLFVVVSIISGVIAARVVGPRRPWAVVLPALAAFGALYLVGHRLFIGFGPEIPLFGFQVAILSDVAFALAAAFAAALAQRAAVRLATAASRSAQG
jgi:hypothetical protein